MNRSLFTPPYVWLPAVIVAFFIACFALNAGSVFYTHQLIDPDDYMRLNEVVSWLKGQNWYDLSVPRLSPGAHTIVHWSRLVDVPIAAVAQIFIPSLGITNAVFAASLIVPFIWFAVLVALLAALGQSVVGETRANLTCIMALFAPMLMFNYSPGRVDHHGIQAIIAGFGLLSLCRIISDDKAIFFAVTSAFTFACGFWIGTEALPWAIIFIACLGVAAAWQGGDVVRRAAVFGLCLPVFTAALIPLALPASDFSSRALSWFSPAYTIFAALAGSIFIIGWIADKHVANKFVRLFLYAALGLTAAATFFKLVPSALLGPFTDYDTFDATTALDNIGEAMPLEKALHFNRFVPITFIPVIVTFARLILLPLVAWIVCLRNAYCLSGTNRLIWLVQSAFLGVALVLTIFWQMRVGIFMELFAIPPLTALLCAWWEKLRWGLWDRPLFWAEIGAFLLLGPLPIYILPSLATHLPIYHLDAFPQACTTQPLDPVLEILNDPSGLGAKTLTIMNVSDLGPKLLLTTSHNVVAGNFDVPGNADAFTFFHATDDTKAQKAAQKWSANLVLLCNNAPTLYLDKDYYAPAHTQMQKGKDGLLHLVNTDAHQPLIERLIRGETPAWLKPIEIPGQSDYLLFEIHSPTGIK